MSDLSIDTTESLFIHRTRWAHDTRCAHDTDPLLTHSDNDAPMQWFFNGINTIGGAAIPINMFILGGALAKVRSRVCLWDIVVWCRLRT